MGELCPAVVNSVTMFLKNAFPSVPQPMWCYLVHENIDSLMRCCWKDQKSQAYNDVSLAQFLWIQIRGLKGFSVFFQSRKVFIQTLV